MPQRVVITGMGTVNPTGLSVQESWDNLIHGVSGVGPITHFDASDLQVRIAAEVKGFNPADYMDLKDARRRDRFEQLAAAAARQALEQSGLEVTEANAGRMGVSIASAIGGIATTQESILTIQKDGPRRVSPFAIPMLMSNGAAGMVSIDYGLRGPSFSVASACASGGDALGLAWMLLRAGVADVMVAGAAEATITEIGVAAFDRLGAMSRRNDDFDQTPAPFDLNRDGLVMGEGAAVLVLESEDHARRRGAEILAELAGYASSADAFHITAPADDGVGGAAAIRQALQSAQVNPSDVGYINAHGTATELNDVSETRAIYAAFGALAQHIPVSSTKSMTGHMMGATAALEAIICVQALRSGCLPPTLHYHTPDPRCNLDVIPNTSREARVKVTISNAFGFGGHNTVLVIKQA